jgi:hypothetical protein
MRLSTGATCALFLAALPGQSPAQAPAALRQRTSDVASLIEAENSKSDICKAYVGKIVSPTPFDSLAHSLAGVRPKGEYETTAQYDARRRAAVAPPARATLLVPIDRDFLRYDADAGAMLVAAGAFVTGGYTGDGVADVALHTMLNSSGVGDGIGLSRVSVQVASAERQTGSELGRNFVGTPVRVIAIERSTKGLSLDGSQPGSTAVLNDGGLFAAARSEASPVTGFQIDAQRAARVKVTLRAALVVDSTPPRVVSGTMSSTQPTAQRPVRYTERATIIVGRPRCGLIVDGAMRVLASADAGPRG